MPFKYGRRAPVHNRRTFRAGLAIARALDPLGPAPKVCTDYLTPLNKATGGDLGMFRNNELGCCTIADTAHTIMSLTANAGQIVIPTDDEVLAAYEAVGGYVPGNSSTDQGCDEAAVCAYNMRTGLAGLKSAGTGPIEPTNQDHIRWTTELFGSCRLGIMVTDSMEQDFAAARPWTILSGEIRGGHDVPVLFFDDDWAYVATWAKIQRISWSLMANGNFLQEAHAEVWPAFIRPTGTTVAGFSLATLLNDLQAIEMQA